MNFVISLYLTFPSTSTMLFSQSCVVPWRKEQDNSFCLWTNGDTSQKLHLHQKPVETEKSTASSLLLHCSDYIWIRNHRNWTQLYF